ncbi:hypothetical protein Tco_0600118 [Tanacetum coccineum]|uniref:Uncharacterized protein n=1 Tax=Tanacetum coccineum TaxID=301880 RepID=A0ABQ4WAV3_9ASTR
MAELLFKTFKDVSLRVMGLTLERVKLHERGVSTMHKKPVLFYMKTTTSNFKADHVDAYDSDCDDEATTSAIFMESLSPAGSINGDTIGPTYDSNIISEVPHYDNYLENDVLNFDVQETKYIEHIVSNNDTCDELTSDSNVISYADYMVTIENDVA